MNAHGASVGNENLSPVDIKRLHRFAQLLQYHVINRHGILKNGVRRDPLYRFAKGLADLSSDVAATLLARLAITYFRLSIRSLPPRPKVQLASSRPVSSAPRGERVEKQIVH